MTARYPGSTIRTSLHARKARGSAAETAAKPPTRTKSSISGVTNSTFKKAPRFSHNLSYAKNGPAWVGLRKPPNVARKSPIHNPAGERKFSQAGTFFDGVDTRLAYHATHDAIVQNRTANGRIRIKRSGLRARPCDQAQEAHDASDGGESGAERQRNGGALTVGEAKAKRGQGGAGGLSSQARRRHDAAGAAAPSGRRAR